MPMLLLLRIGTAPGMRVRIITDSMPCNAGLALPAMAATPRPAERGGVRKASAAGDRPSSLAGVDRFTALRLASRPRIPGVLIPTTSMPPSSSSSSTAAAA